MNSKCKYTCPDGTVHDDLWKKGIANGYGEKTWEKDSEFSEDKYRENWKDDQPNGKGKYVWVDG